MGISGIGYTNYLSFMPGAGRSNSPAAQQTGASAMYGSRSGPLQTPPGQPQTNPVFINGTNPLALYRSVDGDSVELSPPVRRPYSMQPLPSQQAMPARQPWFSSMPAQQPASPAQQSLPAQQPASPAQQSMPAQQPPLSSPPILTIGVNAEPDKPLIPEMPGSGLLDSLKPEGECQTCANRKYVDGSDDPSVSYQTPTKISSSMSAAAVASHEQEHVRNEKADAQREGREIVSQTVSLQYDCCPECGKSYVSGGTTRTTSVSKGDNKPAFETKAPGSDAGGEQNS